MKQTRILLLRHGQSEANATGRFAGWMDFPLSPLGHAQAECTARYILAYDRPDVAYASDLRRAYDTAAHVATMAGLPLTPEPGLREICVGDWEGRVVAELEQEPPFFPWRQDIGHVVCPHGESFAALQARVLQTVDRLAEAHAGETILLGTHACAIRSVESEVCGVDPQTLTWVPNASVTVLEGTAGHWSFCGTVAPAQDVVIETEKHT